MASHIATEIYIQYICVCIESGMSMLTWPTLALLLLLICPAMARKVKATSRISGGLSQAPGQPPVDWQ